MISTSFNGETTQDINRREAERALRLAQARSAHARQEVTEKVTYGYGAVNRINELALAR